MINVNGLSASRIPINGKETLRIMRNGKQLWSGTGLPSGYTLLEYIESTGTQYIDTGFVPNQDTKIIYDIRLDSNVFNKWSGLFCQSGSWLLFGVSADYFEVYLGSQYNYYLSKDTNRKVITFDIQNKSVIVDGINVLTVDSYTNDNNTLPLFCVKRTTGTDSHICMKMYSCKIYDGETLVRDYIPCKNSSGVCGLYDKVNNQFYGSASGTPFSGD